MTDQHSDISGRKGQEGAENRGAPKRYEPEILYPYWAAAGGKVVDAMHFAEDAGEDRVPPKPHTWAKYALQNNFAERLKEEQREQQAQFHAERKENLQPTVDKMTHLYEVVSDLFYRTVLRDVWILTSGDPNIDAKTAREAGMRLTRVFGSFSAMENFLHVFYRTHDLPDRLGHQTVKTSPNTVGYEEFEEEDTRAKTIEERRSRKSTKADEPL